MTRARRSVINATVAGMTDPPATAPDPETAAPESTTGRGETRIQEPTRTERTIARRTAEARATIPDTELRAEVDMSAFVTLTARGGGPSLDAVLARACALALRAAPRANGAYRDGRYELYSRVNVGITVDTPEGAVAVTLFDADRKPARELESELGRLSARARAGAITPPESSGRHVHGHEHRPLRRGGRDGRDHAAAGGGARGRCGTDGAHGARWGYRARTRDVDHARVRPSDPVRRTRRPVPRPHQRPA